MLFLVPIEPLPERYTESWYRNIPKYFDERGVQYSIVHGTPVSKDIKVGTFLDINNTIKYKASQLKTIAGLFENGMVKDGDSFLFYDVEFWGVESVRLISQMNNVRIKMYGFMHAGSYTREDAFSVADCYQAYTEMGWVSAFDKIFVGSQYHKDMLWHHRISHMDDRENLNIRIVVTGMPMFADDYGLSHRTPQDQREEIILLPNRFDWEKRPNVSLDLALLWQNKHPEYKIIVCTSRKKFTSNRQWLVDYARLLEKKQFIEIRENLTKWQYHELLGKARFMLTNSIEENFGYCIAEAQHMGCIPILENDYSHPEMVNFDERFLFNTEDEIIPKMEKLYKGDQVLESELVRNSGHFFKVMDKICDYMLLKPKDIGGLHESSCGGKQGLVGNVGGEAGQRQT